MSISKWPDSRVSKLSIADCPKAIQFPFAELPSFKSHIHLILAIYNFGLKIDAGGFIPKEGDSLADLLGLKSPRTKNTSRYVALQASHPNLSTMVDVCYNLYRNWKSVIQAPNSARHRANAPVYDLASFFDTSRATRSQSTKTGTIKHCELDSSSKLVAVVDARSPSPPTSSHDSTTDSHNSTADVDNGKKPVGHSKKSKRAT